MPVSRSRTDYEVLSRHADANGRVSVRSLVTMLFDAADVHASKWRVSLGQLANTDHTWVLSRLHLRLERQPAWDEPVTVETWPTGAKRILAGRDFRIRSEGQPIGVATTLWLMISRSSRRPVPLPDFVQQFEPPQGSPVVHPPRNWPPPAKSTEVALVERSVRWTDLDLNRHATSTAYLDWLLGPLPADVPESSHLTELDILFKGESFLQDQIRIMISELQEDPAEEVRAFSHSVTRSKDDALLAAARSKWMM
jgi:acyl-ACP thioesterase